MSDKVEKRMSDKMEFNSELIEDAPSIEDLIKKQAGYVPGNKIKYKIGMAQLPANFDPRTPAGVPANQVKDWFYKNSKNELVPVITSYGILDQGECGSCWAFAASVIFTDAARLNINRIYGENASCYICQMFRPCFACTGESGLLKSKRKLYAIETRDGISPYFTIAFSPKANIISSQGSSITKQVTYDFEHDCEKVYLDWLGALQFKIKPADLIGDLGAKYANCTGCRGNFLASPLVLYTQRGAPLLSDFPIHEFACFFGSSADRDQFCSEEYLSGNITYNLYKLLKTDLFSYSSIRDFDVGDYPKGIGINSFEDWMMLNIYNYGPIIAGFNVYYSFRNFFRNPVNRKSIYTANDFINDINKGQPIDLIGVHSVVIVGWGEEKRESITSTSETSTKSTSTIKYWIVLNDLGDNWGNNGFFRIEKEFDKKLKEANIKQKINLETEFGAVYFAPHPNGDLWQLPDGKIHVNNMSDFLQKFQSKTCPSAGENPDIVKIMDGDCNCRCAYYYDTKTQRCEKITKRIGAPMDRNKSEFISSQESIASQEFITGQESMANQESISPKHNFQDKNLKLAMLFILLIIIVNIIILIIICSVRSTQKDSICIEENSLPRKRHQYNLDIQ